MLDNKLIKLLKPLKLKYFIKRIIHFITISLMIWGAVSLAFMIVSRLFPITFVWNKVFIALIVFLMMGIFWSIYKKPSYMETAKLLDNFGLKERASTSLELNGDNGLISSIQKKDTIRLLEKEDLKSKISLKPSMKILLFIFIFLAATIMISFIPTKSYVIAKEKEQVSEKLEVEKAKIEKVKEEIKKDERLSLDEKKELEKSIDKIRSNLQAPKNIKNAQKEIVKFKKELNKISEAAKQKKIDKIAKNLESKSFTKELANKLRSRSSHEVAKEIEKMVNKLKDSNKEELEKIAQELKDLQELLKNNPELAKAFKEIRDAMAQSIQKGQQSNSTVNQSLQDLNQKINDILNDPQLSNQMNEVLGSINELNNTLDQISGNSKESGLNNQNQSNDADKNSNQGACPTGEHNGEGGG